MTASNDIQPDPSSDLTMSLAQWMTITPVMCHSIDSNGILVSVSDSWLRKFGYRKDEVIGRPSSSFLTEASRERARKEILPEFFRTGRTENADYEMVCKNGTVIDVLLSGVMTSGTPELGPISIAVITDVTQLKLAEKKLADNESRYRHLVENQSEMVSLATIDGQLLFVNDAYARHHQMIPEAMIGSNFLDFVPPGARADLTEHLSHLAAIGHTLEIENQVLSPDGQLRWMSWTNKVLMHENGSLVTIHSVGKDIDARVNAEKSMKDSEARYRLLAENSTDMVFQLDADMVFRYVSPACVDILGYDVSELIGSDFARLIHPDDKDGIPEASNASGSGQARRHTAIHRCLHRDGHYVWGEIQLRMVQGMQAGSACETVGTLRDFTERKQMEDQLREANSRLTRIAATDGLTGLLNRRAFDAALAREFGEAQARGGDMGLILADVDWFKAYNDHYGHPAGDECLQKVSAVLGDVEKEFGYPVARYGGEEFCIIVPGADENTAFLIAERLRLAVAGIGIRHDASPMLTTTVSLGVASLKGSGASASGELVDIADRALYDAKRSGRNTIVRASACCIVAMHRGNERSYPGR